jgi:hypothetical protein
MTQRMDFTLTTGLHGMAWPAPWAIEQTEVVGVSLIPIELTLIAGTVELYHGIVIVVGNAFDARAVQTALEHVMTKSIKHGIYKEVNQ